MKFTTAREIGKAVQRARQKHASPPNFIHLVEEVGEVANAIQGGHVDTVCAELLDLMAVCVRMYEGDTMSPSQQKEGNGNDCSTIV